ncbi:histidine phosphatase family protein [uncultured Aliiroseovarius sp.]|uniref:histidine phosphatase family protein n=1 Tax=uncultured Aliiroseovarius sp. TaxID=1658783 RepID=UPI00262E205D|nr:histidine phosphatase family protein [uncultured Aliiroseovarius sp.]
MGSIYPEIFVIRHGQTVWNAAGRHQGRLDSPLTAKGRRQAIAMAGMLRREIGDRTDVTVFSSPQGRSLNTARIATAWTGASIVQDARLAEIAFGAWEGKTMAQVRAGWPTLATLAEQDMVSWHFNAPGGETLLDLEARTESFLHTLETPAVIFTHGILSRVLRARWLGVDEDGMMDLPGGQGIIFHLHPDLGHRVIEK